MAHEIHYEIFSRRGSKGGWRLIDVKPDRDEAIDFAQFQMSEGATGVKVVKETYNDETGDYLSLKIFEEGLNKLKTKPAQEDVPHALPCFKPDDLYSYYARQTIARLIPEFLARNRVTVTELCHRADILEKLEATGTLLQHAIQKVAVAQASSTAMPVQQIIKALNELTTKAFHRVYRDSRNSTFPKVQQGEFGALAARLANQPDGVYVLNGALARMLADAGGWDEKVFQLISLMDEAPEEGPGGKLLISAIDTIIAEILGGSAALHELIGKKDNLAAALMSLVQLFLGQEPDAADGEQQGLISLTHRIANDELPAARTAIASRITAEFKSVKRLCPDSLFDEFMALRQIANRVVLGVGKYLSHEDLVAAFTLRSKRLVTHETLSEHLADAAAPDEKLERLLFVEENTIGIENKRQLATFVIPIVTSSVFENHFHSPKMPVIARLQRLAELQAHLLRSNFQENQRVEIADMLDRLASGVEARARLLESIEAKPVSHVEKAVTILNLLTAETFTEGRLCAKAREQIVAYLSKPGFLSGYAAQMATTAEDKPDAGTVMAELIRTLERAGITQETGLKSIAA